MTCVTTASPVAASRLEHPPDPCAMVIFGASGDLTKRKLMPALYTLVQERYLPPGFSVVGFSRSDMSDDQFRAAMKDGVTQFGGGAPDAQVWAQFALGLRYLSGHPAHPEEYKRLADILVQLDQQRGTRGNRLFYLAVPPSSIDDIVNNLNAAGLAQPANGSWTRIIVEKPFGTDLDSARELNRRLLKVFDETQIYRIDHYLGKETVQNLMVFRFANGIFEPVWNRRYVDHVQITAAETLGVENRAGYFEESGELRDMVQNHLMQVLAITAMEPPVTFDAENVREEKSKALRAIRPFTDREIFANVVRGQYGPGAIDGKQVSGYRQEPGVNPNSVTETYVAMKLFIENWRWAGVPFLLRAGKRMSHHVTEIAIHFKKPPLLLFERTAADQIEPNVLAIRIQPDEGISLKFGAKQPGPANHVREVNMDFRYASAFGMASSNAYERLLLDCMAGDATLFARGDAVEAAWAAVTPVLKSWQAGPAPQFPNYPAGGWGPDDSKLLTQGACCGWRQP